MKSHEKTKARLNDKQRNLFEVVEHWHGEQKRKYTKEPYTRHLLAVANIILNLPVQISGLVEIALCHDLFEDTEFPQENMLGILLATGYSKGAAKFIELGIIALTDEFTGVAYPGINRKKRKGLEAERLGTIDPLYQTVKYADIIDNTSSIVKHDSGFAKVYMQEIQRVMDVMRGGNIVLRHKCDALVKQYFENQTIL